MGGSGPLDQRSPLLWGIIHRVWFRTDLTLVDIWLCLATWPPVSLIGPCSHSGMAEVQLTDGRRRQCFTRVARLSSPEIEAKH